MTEITEQVLVNRSMLAVMLGCGRKKTYRMAEIDTRFPKPLRDACGTQMWRKQDVLDYINQLWERANDEA